MSTMDISIDQLRSLPQEKRLEIIDALWESVERDTVSHGSVCTHPEF